MEFGSVLDWSADGKRILAGHGAGVPFTTELWTLPIESTDKPPARVVSLPGHGLGAGAALSPDGRWVSFTAWKRDVESGSALFVARIADGATHALTDYTRWHERPRWTPDGRTIYFMSSDLRGTFSFNVWGLRFDPARGHSIGAAYQITNLEGPAYAIDAREPALALWRDRLLVQIAESAGSIWMLDGIRRTR